MHRSLAIRLTAIIVILAATAATLAAQGRGFRGGGGSGFRGAPAVRSAPGAAFFSHPGRPIVANPVAPFVSSPADNGLIHSRNSTAGRQCHSRLVCLFN